MPEGMPAVVLLSGGLDSATTLAIAAHEGFAVHAMSFRYGQPSQILATTARKLISNRAYHCAALDLVKSVGAVKLLIT
jgi:7-cyano-7-deazaguanine synthase in queuosine biosynthesis